MELERLVGEARERELQPMPARERIVAARRSGESVEGVAQRFGVCTKTVRAYEKRAAQGQLAPTPQTGKARRLSDQEHEALRALVQERSDWTLASLAQSWQERQERQGRHSTETHPKRAAVSPLTGALMMNIRIPLRPGLLAAAAVTSAT